MAGCDVLSVVIVTSGLAGLTAAVNVTSRCMFALARARLLPVSLAATHATRHTVAVVRSR